MANIFKIRLRLLYHKNAEFIWVKSLDFYYCTIRYVDIDGVEHKIKNNRVADLSVDVSILKTNG